MWKPKCRSFFVAALAIAIASPNLAAWENEDSRARVVNLFQQAGQAEEANDFSKATALYREIVSLDPSIAEVWSNLGMALYHQEQYKPSIAAFEKAAALKPALLSPHLFMGLAYLKMGAAAPAISPLKAALAIEPNQPEATLALGDAYSQTNQFEAAVRLLQEALKQEPESEDLRSNLAVTYLD